MPESKDMLSEIKNSPIFLAILEIRYIDSELKDIENLSIYRSDLSDLFPNFQKQITSQLKLDNLLEGQTSIHVQNQKVDCFLYSSEDRQSEFTVSLNRFNYRQNGTYTNFEDFTKNIKTAWEIHYPLLKKVVITGISLRCFNKIEIVELVQDPSEYFNISIQAGQDVIKDVVVNYSIRYISKNFNDNRHSIVALSLEDQIQNIFPFVLDIDVHDDNPINNDLELLWNKFESLRVEKDRLFNSLLTEKTKNLYL